MTSYSITSTVDRGSVTGVTDLEHVVYGVLDCVEASPNAYTVPDSIAA
jgi:hypothetical protein